MKWFSGFLDHPFGVLVVWPIKFTAYGVGLDIRWRKSQRAEAMCLAIVAITMYALIVWLLFQDFLEYWGRALLVVGAYLVLAVLAALLHWRAVEKSRIRI